jgi:outer membrane protein OmpA-like peptidoglycan-associated protein
MKSLFPVLTLGLSLTLSGCCMLGTVLPLHNYGVIAGADAPSTKNELAGIADTTGSGDTMKVNLSGDFTFKKGSAELSSAAAKQIKAIANVLKKDSKNKVTVVGFTDNSGTPEGNQKLSENRAKAVMKELVKGGVVEANVKSEGKGEKDPVASNVTEEGRSKNRRTELRIAK